MDIIYIKRRLRVLKMTQQLELLNRITYNPQQCGGKPCIRGMRIRGTDILEMLALNVEPSEILEDFPDLEPEDIQACLLLAAQRTNIPKIIA